MNRVTCQDKSTDRQIYRQTNLPTEIPSCISLACSSARPAASQLARRHSGAESLTQAVWRAPHRNCRDLWLWIPDSARGACARTAHSADPSARGPGMTTSRLCHALQLSTAFPRFESYRRTKNLVLRSALFARVSKDGHKQDRASGHPSRRSARKEARRASQDEVCGFKLIRSIRLVSWNRFSKQNWTA
jgi:hypothetical protein